MLMSLKGGFTMSIGIYSRSVSLLARGPSNSRWSTYPIFSGTAAAPMSLSVADGGHAVT